jgi:hypothetical protein
MSTPLERARQRGPVDTVYDRTARQLEARCPGWEVRYDRGYIATSEGQEPIRGTCAQAVEAQIKARRRR